MGVPHVGHVGGEALALELRARGVRRGPVGVRRVDELVPVYIRYGYSLCYLGSQLLLHTVTACYIRLQPLVHAVQSLLHTVTASIAYGYSLHCIRLQPLLHTVTSSVTEGYSLQPGRQLERPRHRAHEVVAHPAAHLVSVDDRDGRRAVGRALDVRSGYVTVMKRHCNGNVAVV